MTKYLLNLKIIKKKNYLKVTHHYKIEIKEKNCSKIILMMKNHNHKIKKRIRKKTQKNKQKQI